MYKIWKGRSSFGVSGFFGLNFWNAGAFSGVYNVSKQFLEILFNFGYDLIFPSSNFQRGAKVDFKI